MKKLITLSLSLACFFALSNSIFSKETNEKEISAKEIFKKSLNLDDGKSSYSEVILISCNFTETAGKRKCTSSKRKKSFESLGKDLDSKGEITMNLSLVKEPASDKGIGFLQKDYDDESNDSEQWMYLPTLKKLKKVVSFDQSGPKTGTLFGSEIAYEDIEKRHLSNFIYKKLPEETISNIKSYVIESSPTASFQKKSSYRFFKTWVDKSNFTVLKSEAYDSQKNLVKSFINRKYENISGVWTAKQMIIINHKTNRMSMMQRKNIKINIDFPNDLFTPRALNDHDYLNSQLRKIK